MIDADERQQVVRHPIAFRLVHDELLDACAQLLGADIRRIVLGDPSLRLHHLCHRPEADAVAVGQRAALSPPHEIRVALEVREERADETRLADPRNADERHELRLALRPRPPERVDDHAQLAGATDERQRRALDVHPEPGAQLHRFPDGNGF